MGVAHTIRTAFKEALRTGKIRETTTQLKTSAHKMADVNTPSVAFRHLPPRFTKKGCRKPVHGVCTGMFSHNAERFDLFRTSDWTRYMKDCDEAEWEEFVTKEKKS